jgi:hypothetical protein
MNICIVPVLILLHLLFQVSIPDEASFFLAKLLPGTRQLRTKYYD